jgi:serine/threonine protein kinase
MFLPYAPGQDIIDFVANKNDELTLEECIKIALEMIKEVKACHDAGIVHGDINNGNFLVASIDKKDNKVDAQVDHKVTLIDYGFSELLPKEEKETNAYSVVQSVRGPLPEYIGERYPKVSTASDVYKFGDVFDIACYILGDSKDFFINLANEMHAENPESRPTTQQVINTLELKLLEVQGQSQKSSLQNKQYDDDLDMGEVGEVGDLDPQIKVPFCEFMIQNIQVMMLGMVFGSSIQIYRLHERGAKTASNSCKKAASKPRKKAARAVCTKDETYCVSTEKSTRSIWGVSSIKFGRVIFVLYGDLWRCVGEISPLQKLYLEFYLRNRSMEKRRDAGFKKII